MHASSRDRREEASRTAEPVEAARLPMGHNREYDKHPLRTYRILSGEAFYITTMNTIDRVQV